MCESFQHSPHWITEMKWFECMCCCCWRHHWCWRVQRFVSIFFASISLRIQRMTVSLPIGVVSVCTSMGVSVLTRKKCPFHERAPVFAHFSVTKLSPFRCVNRIPADAIILRHLLAQEPHSIAILSKLTAKAEWTEQHLLLLRGRGGENWFNLWLTHKHHRRSDFKSPFSFAMCIHIVFEWMLRCSNTKATGWTNLLSDTHTQTRQRCPSIPAISNKIHRFFSCFGLAGRACALHAADVTCFTCTEVCHH